MQIKLEKKIHWNKFYKTFNIKSESNFSKFIIKWLKINNDKKLYKKNTIL